LPIDRPARTITPWTAQGPLLRLHAGLEDPEALWQDLSAALDVYIHAQALAFN